MLPRIPLFLLLCILPLGVAGHHIGTGVIAVMLFALLWINRESMPLRELWQQHRIALCSAVAFMVVQVLSTRLNPANPEPSSVHYLYGHIIWAFLPALVCLGQPPLQERDWVWLLRVLAFIALILGGMAVSQTIWGWKLQQSHIVYGFQRAQGLYSHPMSFGYVCLLFVPVANLVLIRWPRRAASWVLALSIAAGILASRSRMVEAVTCLVILYNIWIATRGALRLKIFGAAVVLIAIVLATPNPVSVRFQGMLTHQDVHGDFPDDRVAFWEVNWLMVTERPLLGHGEGLTTAYRVPYYAAKGLANFPRLYEAHNMFLQEAVNGGFIGLAVFLVWLGDLYWFARRARRAGYFAGRVMTQTVGALCLAAMTQNAFQDSAVRYTLTLAVTGLWLALAPQQAKVPPLAPLDGDR